MCVLQKVMKGSTGITQWLVVTHNTGVSEHCRQLQWISFISISLWPICTFWTPLPKGKGKTFSIAHKQEVKGTIQVYTGIVSIILWKRAVNVLPDVMSPTFHTYFSWRASGLFSSYVFGVQDTWLQLLPHATVEFSKISAVARLPRTTILRKLH